LTCLASLPWTQSRPGPARWLLVPLDLQGALLTRLLLSPLPLQLLLLRLLPLWPLLLPPWLQLMLPPWLLLPGLLPLLLQSPPQQVHASG
jgi:hypothetical protein